MTLKIYAAPSKLKVSERERELSLNEGNDQHCRPLPLTLSCSHGFLNFETKSMLKFAVSSLSSSSSCSASNLELSWKSRGNLSHSQKNGNENEFEAWVHITRRRDYFRAGHRFLLEVVLYLTYLCSKGYIIYLRLC